MTELRPALHSQTGALIVEVWEDGHMIAVVCPAHRGLRIVSKYLGVDPETVAVDDQIYPPALNIRIWDGQPRSSALDETIREGLAELRRRRAQERSQ